MRTLNRELMELLDAEVPPLLDLEQLERLVTADELSELEGHGDCELHEGCRPIR